ncbi:uncharacterized protein LOC118356453 [Zalophus californianus]|uniref:Uncharacterized protein LOC118356453 n=1 Tax=Zalophus californianus TaxID=9704 RepID=A0A6P9F6S0_ZALCA|nr:uncharacterized protein LOC118356453 [Zalophus californianus]
MEKRQGKRTFVPCSNISCTAGGPGSGLGDARHTEMTQTRALPLWRCQSCEGDSCVNRGSKTSARMHQTGWRIRVGFLKEVMSRRSRVLTDEELAKTKRAHDHTDVRGWNGAGHRANPWAPASSALEEGAKTCLLETISRSLEKSGEWTACSTDGGSRRGALGAPDGGSQRNRCREPPSVVSAAGLSPAGGNSQNVDGGHDLHHTLGHLLHIH